MNEHAEVALNPFSRFGFERLFGTCEHEASLIDFLQQIPGLAAVNRISFISPSDLFGESECNDSVFDLFCQDAEGIPIKIQVQLLASDQWWEKSLSYAYLYDYQEYVVNAAPYPTYCVGILISDQHACPMKYIEDAYLWRFSCTYTTQGEPDARFHFIYIEPSRFGPSLSLETTTAVSRPAEPPDGLSDVAEPSAVSTGAAEPSDSLSGAAEPSDSLSDVAEPSDSLSGAAEPSDSLSGVAEPSDSLSGMAEPSDSLSGAAEPSAVSTGAAEPSDSLSGVAEPSDSLSGAAVPPDVLSGAASVRAVKPVAEKVSRLHQWLYVLSNLPLLSINGPMADDPLFFAFIQSAMLSNLCAEEQDAYNRSLDNYFH